MERNPPSLCAILLGLAETCPEAEEYVALARRCPYVALASANGLLTVGVYVVPESKRWWIDVPAQQPHLLGLEKAWLIPADGVEAASPWSRGEVQPVLEMAPCGSDCATCPQYHARCPGCPATRFLRSEKPSLVSS